MNRKQEIEIIIKHLERDVKRTANGYPELLSDIIVRNGKLIEGYEKELEDLK